MDHKRCPDCKTKVHPSWLEGRHSTHEIQMDSEIESAEELVGVSAIPAQCKIESAEELINTPEIPDPHGIESAEEQKIGIEGSSHSNRVWNRVSSEADEGSSNSSSGSFVDAESDSANEEFVGELTLEQ